MVVIVAMVLVVVVVVVVMAFGLNPHFMIPNSLRGTLISNSKGDFFSLGFSLCPKENRISSQPSFPQSEAHRRKYQWSQPNFLTREEGFFLSDPDFHWVTVH